MLATKQYYGQQMSGVTNRMPWTNTQVEAYLTDQYGEVEASFILHEVPAGDAPLNIREQWLHIPLPVRAAHLGKAALEPKQYVDVLSGNERDNTEPISITGRDAVKALDEAERWEASDFWTRYQFGIFVFRRAEGLLQFL